MTVLQVLNKWAGRLNAQQVENPRLNAELMVAHGLGLTREKLYQDLHREIAPKEEAIIESLMQRRIQGEPLQYIVGHQEFWSIDLHVDARVLIPRPETELLIEQAVIVLSKAPFKAPLRILEIGTGSGAIAISLARELKNAFMVATDVSNEALRLAKANARGAGVDQRIAFVQGDLFAPFRRVGDKGGVDVVVSNPPYVVRSEIGALAKEVKNHEPLTALDGGEDGLDFYRRIIDQAPAYLNDPGWLLLEMGQGQGASVSRLIRQRGAFQAPELVQDLAGIERVIKAEKLKGRSQ